MEQLLSEQRNRASERVDRVSTVELLEIINREDQTVADAVSREIPRIVAAVDAIVERFRQSGRMFYLGAGTSGRLGVLDAAECPPTFGTPAERVQGLLAGGEAAIFRASEGSEDDPRAGQSDLEAPGFRPPRRPCGNHRQRTDTLRAGGGGLCSVARSSHRGTKLQPRE